MLTNKHAHRVLMQLLAPDSHRYLPPAIYEIIHPAAKTVMVSAAAAAGAENAAGLDEDEEPDFMDAEGGEGGESDREQQQEEEDGDEGESEEGDGDGEEGSGSEGDGEENGEGSPAEQQGAAEEPAKVSKQLGESKKDPAVRRQELLGSGPDSLGAQLVSLCAEHAVQLLASPVGSEVLVEVARGAAGGLLWQQHQAGVQAVHQALLQQLQQDVAALSSSGKQQPKQQQQNGKKGKGSGGSEEAAGAAEPLLTHYYASRALRRLLLAAGSDEDEGAAARAFAEQLWQQVLQGQCKHLVGGHAEKVVAGLLHCNVRPVEQAVTAELKPLVGGDVQQWAAKFLGPPGGQQQGHQLQHGRKQQQGQKQQQQKGQQPSAGKQSKGSSKQEAQQQPVKKHKKR
jgi:pumilio family protein 6